ncbi:methyltransferase domain-containing protein [Kitasatospora sp. NBC_01302]|uniref:methyltransferase domain-containing protein n=1 Tax=Kitasatospora sp. NBC_01302 TaxID=2903575 RepID=UPI002E1480FC|nr:methyltransferase domain-containing protein [Kitasatospora sp. NBC_01302]
MTDASTGRRRLAATLEAAGALDAQWRDAILAVPRHLFLPDVYWATTTEYIKVDRTSTPHGWMGYAYQDVPIVTQWDNGACTGEQVPTSSASMPTMVATMLRHLEVQPGGTVLEIGTGTGYNAGLLAHRLGGTNVVTVEVDPDVADQARKALAEADLHPQVITGDGAHGWPGDAPYDRVLATCSVIDIPQAWIAQTRPGGIIVTPVGTLFGGGALAKLTVGPDGTASGPFVGSSAFMLLRQQRYQAPPVDDYLPDEWPGDAGASLTSLDPEAIGDDWLAQFVIGLQLPDVYYRRTPNGDGWTWWLFDTGVTSWATVDSTPGDAEFDVRQSGPRRLWDEIETAYQWWTGAGRPSFERFGLTIDQDGGRPWLDRPGNPVRAR